MNFTLQQKQVLALAALFQNCYLVYQLGSDGKCDEQAFINGINSIYSLEAPDFTTVYGSKENLSLGLNVLYECLNQKNKSKIIALISRYAFDVMFVQHKLMKDSEKLAFIRQRLQQATVQKNYFQELNDTIIDNLSDIYSNSISEFRHKVQIIGKVEHIRNQKVFNKIRAILLAAVRASVLWQQLGGRKWHLFFKRARIVDTIKELIDPEHKI